MRELLIYGLLCKRHDYQNNHSNTSSNKNFTDNEKADLYTEVEDMPNQMN